MIAARARGPIVIDTNVFGADLVPGSPLADRYEPVIVGRPAFISFQTVAELYFGALQRGWHPSRILKMEAKLARVEVVHSGPELVLVHARLRVACLRIGHALAQRAHEADRWIAATALRLACRSSPTTRSSARYRDSRSKPRPEPSDRFTRLGSGVRFEQ